MRLKRYEVTFELPHAKAKGFCLMSIKEKYTIRSIDTEQTKEWLIYKHYAKRMPSISYAFGLYQKQILIGVLTIGKPASPFLCDGICGADYATFVYELNRLCVNEGLEENTLSYFVGASLRLIKDNLIIVSYADTEWGHHGYIYQATNWIYTGITDLKYDKVIKGMETHARHNNVYEKQNLEYKMKKRSQKHRYIYFLGKRKKEFLSKLNYPKQAYPKGDNQRYDANYKPKVQISLF